MFVFYCVTQLTVKPSEGVLAFNCPTFNFFSMWSIGHKRSQLHWFNIRLNIFSLRYFYRHIFVLTGVIHKLFCYKRNTTYYWKIVRVCGAFEVNHWAMHGFHIMVYKNLPVFSTCGSNYSYLKTLLLNTLQETFRDNKSIYCYIIFTGCCIHDNWPLQCPEYRPQ